MKEVNLVKKRAGIEIGNNKNWNKFVFCGEVITEFIHDALWAKDYRIEELEKEKEILRAENTEFRTRLAKAELCFKLAVDTMRYEFAGCSEIERACELMLEEQAKRVNGWGNERAYEFFKQAAEARLKELEGK